MIKAIIFAIFGLVGSSRLSTHEATAEELALIDYVIDNGGMVKYTIGRECSTCLRGAIAIDDIAANDLVLAIPLILGIPLPRLDHQGFASEYAHGLVQRFKTDKEFNATYSLFWSTQPKSHEILTSESFTDKLANMLHTPELERLLKVQSGVAEDVYYGRYHWHNYEPLPEILTGKKAVSLDEFKYSTSVISTRDFALEEQDPETGGPVYMLFPVADMVNHDDLPNASRNDNGTHVLMHALEDIKKGDSVTNNYQPGVIYRNDMALYIYGFIQESNAEVMCAIDLPLYNPDEPFGQTKEDSWFYGPEGRFNSPSELARLKSLLDEAEGKSTIAEDEELLKSGNLNDWKEETVIKFRMGRKKALKKAISTIENVLKAKAAGGALDNTSKVKDEL